MPRSGHPESERTHPLGMQARDRGGTVPIWNVFGRLRRRLASLRRTRIAFAHAGHERVEPWIAPGCPISLHIRVAGPDLQRKGGCPVWFSDGSSASVEWDRGQGTMSRISVRDIRVAGARRPVESVFIDAPGGCYPGVREAGKHVIRVPTARLESPRGGMFLRLAIHPALGQRRYSGEAAIHVRMEQHAGAPGLSRPIFTAKSRRGGLRISNVQPKGRDDSAPHDWFWIRLQPGIASKIGRLRASNGATLQPAQIFMIDDGMYVHVPRGIRTSRIPITLRYETDDPQLRRGEWLPCERREAGDEDDALGRFASDRARSSASIRAGPNHSGDCMRLCHRVERATARTAW